MSIRSFGLVTLMLCAASLCRVARADDAAVKKALQAEYTTMAAAWKQGDLKGFMRMYTPDFKRTLPGGKVRSRAEEEAAYRDLLAHTSRPDQVRLKVLRARIHGNKAVVVVDVWWSLQGSYIRHLIDTDTWIKTARGWKLKASAQPHGDKFQFTDLPKSS